MTHILRMVRHSLGPICRRNVYVMALLASTCAYAQMFTFSKQELIDYTAKSPFDRFADGRPKVSDAMIERARDLSSEEVWAGLHEEGFKNQYADGVQVLHPGKTMVGRAFAVQFMPLRADVDQVSKNKAKERGLPGLTNQTAIDMPAYFRSADPTPSGNVMLTGITCK